MKRMIRWFGLCALVCLLLVPASAAAQQPVRLSFGTFNSGSGWYIMGQTMARMMEKALPPGSGVDVLPYSGGVGNPRLIGQDKAQIALGFPVETGLAIRGEEPYPKALPELKGLVGGLDVYWYAFAVRDSVPVKSFAELKEKKYPLKLTVLQKGGSGEWMTRQVLAFYGISYDNLSSWGGKVTFTSFPGAVEMVQDGHAEAFGQVCTPGHPSWQQLATKTRIRFLPIGEDAAKTLIKKYGFSKSAIPAKTFAGVESDVPVLGFATCLIASDKLPVDVAYKITKTVCEGKEELASQYKAAKAFDPRKAWDLPVPLHPGAVKYYKEAGYMK
ncbi:MAG: TAXI family TRAP transporter solute-binding subunit [Deltaproteobacteria bacterium]|nr:TAXI family TRAP transporter solute-binding subunit [Deltaproteobacteria bacterium]